MGQISPSCPVNVGSQDWLEKFRKTTLRGGRGAGDIFDLVDCRHEDKSMCFSLWYGLLKWGRAGLIFTTSLFWKVFVLLARNRSNSDGWFRDWVSVVKFKYHKFSGLLKQGTDIRIQYSVMRYIVFRCTLLQRCYKNIRIKIAYKEQE